jgi:hypothetical protein
MTELTEAEREAIEDVLREADRIQGFADRLLMDPDDVVLALIDTPATGPNLHSTIERIIDARLAPIRALADEWETYSATDEWHAADCWNAAPGILRAVLAGATDEEDG